MPVEYLSYFSGHFSIFRQYLDAVFDYIKILLLAIIATSAGLYYLVKNFQFGNYLHYYYAVYLNM